MNIGLGQIAIIVILLFLLWGNFPQIVKNVFTSFHEFLEILKKKTPPKNFDKSSDKK